MTAKKKKAAKKKNTQWGYIPKTITIRGINATHGTRLRVKRGSDNPNYPLWHIPIRTTLMKDKYVNCLTNGRLDDIEIEKETGYFVASYLGMEGESKTFRGAVKSLEREMRRTWQHLGEILGHII